MWKILLILFLFNWKNEIFWSNIKNVFWINLNMPIKVFGNINNNKIDTNLFVQKPYLRSNYIESNIEEDIDLKNQFRIKT